MSIATAHSSALRNEVDADGQTSVAAASGSSSPPPTVTRHCERECPLLLAPAPLAVASELDRPLCWWWVRPLMLIAKPTPDRPPLGGADWSCCSALRSEACVPPDACAHPQQDQRSPARPRCSRSQGRQCVLASRLPRVANREVASTRRRRRRFPPLRVEVRGSSDRQEDGAKAERVDRKVSGENLCGHALVEAVACLSDHDESDNDQEHPGGAEHLERTRFLSCWRRWD
jgi:hypothetical protein